MSTTLTVTCEGGHETPAQTAQPDLSGGWLCPPCAADSAVPCDVCGRTTDADEQSLPVWLMNVGDSDAPSADPTMTPVLGMVGQYMAVCRDCNEGTTR